MHCDLLEVVLVVADEACGNRCFIVVEEKISCNKQKKKKSNPKFCGIYICSLNVDEVQ